MQSDLDYSQVIQNSYNEKGNNINVGNACSTSNITRVASSTSNTVLLVANSTRRSVIFFNESTSICYICFGAGASTTNYTVQIPANSSLIVNAVNYTGEFDAVWSSANGAMQITELTQ